MQFKKMAAVVSSALAVSAVAHAQDAVQWRVEDGGNGHWYGITPTTGTWQQDRDFALQRGGDLATVTSASESTFLCTGILSSGPWSGQACWMGMTRQPDGSFAWVSGEPVQWTNWYPSTPHTPPYEVVWITGPNNGGSNPCYWNDADPTPSIGHIYHGLIEWSADCNSDGIVDYGQIRAGELVDVNANNIPDCCEQGVSCAPCLGDVDESGTVNGVDLAAILAVWGSDGGKYPRADTNNDGVVNGADLATVLGSWGSCE